MGRFGSGLCIHVSLKCTLKEGFSYAYVLLHVIGKNDNVVKERGRLFVTKLDGLALIFWGRKPFKTFSLSFP